MELSVLSEVITLGKRGTSLFFVVSYLVDSSALCDSTNAAISFFLCVDFSILILTENNEILINRLKSPYTDVVSSGLCFQYNTLKYF